MFDEGAKTLRIGELVFLLERQPDDFESLVVILPIQLHQERSLIMTVRAPAPHDADDHNFALETSIGIRHDVAGQVRETEAERVFGVAHAGVLQGVCRWSESFRARRLGTVRNVFVLPVLNNLDAPVLLWSDLE